MQLGSLRFGTEPAFVHTQTISWVTFSLILITARTAFYYWSKMANKLKPFYVNLKCVDIAVLVLKYLLLKLHNVCVMGH